MAISRVQQPRGPVMNTANDSKLFEPAAVPALRILVVDDDRGEFLLLESSLTMCGADVEMSTATTGHLAIVGLLTTSDDQLPNLAIVDVGMPMISGFEVAQYLICHGIPTIMISALVTPERRERAFAIGALDLLAKPQDAAGYRRLASQVLDYAQLGRTDA